jgi:hypothetical protein
MKSLHPLLLSAFCGTALAAATPNVVVIFMDDMGYGDIGAYGATKQKTPHLDRMAAEGMKLTSFYAAPVCSVSRAQMMTGCYGARISVPGVYFPGHTNGLNPAETTIAEHLKQQGYATQCIGKWHLGDQPEFLPTKQGFDHYFGIPYSNDMQKTAKDTGAKVVPLMRDDKVAELLTDEAQSRIVERVAKLLALAASASEHEAQTAMNTAQRLMLEHNVAEAQRTGRSFISRTLGEPSGRLEEARSYIGGLLMRHFFVESVELRVWMARQGRRGTVIEITGTPENVAMAEYVYTFLDRTAEALWGEHKRRQGIPGDRDRRAFRAGVIRGFRRKLESERAGHQEQGLVWVGDPALREHHRTRYPRLVHVRRGGSSGHEARRHGEAAGQTVVLHRPVEGGHSTRPSGPLRLGPGKS